MDLRRVAVLCFGFGLALLLPSGALSEPAAPAVFSCGDGSEMPLVECQALAERAASSQERQSGTWHTRTADPLLSWESVTVVHSGGETYSPAIAMGPSDEVYVGYQDGLCDGYVLRSDDSGDTFGERVHSATLVCQSFALAAGDEGSVYFAWNREAISMTQSSDHGASFPTEVRVDDGTVYAINPWARPDLALGTDGSLYVVFAPDWPDAVFFTKSTDGGSSFCPLVRLAEIIDYRGVPSIAVAPNGTVYVVWATGNAAHFNDLYFTRSTDGGDTFEDAQRLNEVSLSVPQQFLKFDLASAGNDHVHVVWTDERNGNRDTYYDRSLDGGATFEGNVMLNDDAGQQDQTLPSIAVGRSGEVMVAWFDMRSTVYGGTWGDIYTVLSTDRGASFSTNVRANPEVGSVPGSGSGWSAVAFDGWGRPHVVWNDYHEILHVRAVGPTPQLSVAHLEVTQAIQDEQNGVPLIAGKPTFVRVYVDCGFGCTSLRDVTGVLRGYGPSGELPGSPRSPVNRSITAQHVSWQSQRGSLDKTLNYQLPTGWDSGTVTLTAEISGTTTSETVTFEEARDVTVIYLPVRHDGQVPTSRIESAHHWAMGVWPSTHINYVPWSIMNWSPPISCYVQPVSRCPALPEETEVERYIRCMRTCFSADLKTKLTEMYWQGREDEEGYIFGWLPESANLGAGGSSDPSWSPGGVGKAAWGLDYPTEGPRVFAHEIGHLMEQQHTNTGECPDKDPSTDWPYASARIDEYGLDGFGFGWLASSSNAVKTPTGHWDYMSYCGKLEDNDVWTSAWTYGQIYSETLQIPAAALVVEPLIGSEPHLIASGLVFTDGMALLNPVWIISTAVPGDNPPAGAAYCLEAQDGSGTPLAGHCFDLAFLNYETGEPTAVDGFNVMLPYPAGVTRIVLRKGTAELAVQLVSDSAPVVTVTSPNGGETWAASDTYTITWTASDLDGDPLTYSVLYSPDGADWVPVGAAITTTQLAVSAAELAGGNAARVRVMATDGVNTSTDESDAAFTVGLKPPEVFIVRPEEDGVALGDTSVWLEGSAYDREDGMLESTSLQWQSSRDGPLGTGSLVLASLSHGQHTITLTATDSDAETTTRTVEILATFREDIVADCRVDIVDVMTVASRWQCQCGEECYNSLYDLDGDCDITVADIMSVAGKWGCTCGDASCAAVLGAASSTGPGQKLSTARARLDPEVSTVEPGDVFTAHLRLLGASTMGAFQLALDFDPAVLEVHDVTLGEFLASTGRTVAPLGPEIDNDAGRATFGGFSFGDGAGASGDGVLATITLRAQGNGSTWLELEDVQLVDTLAQPIEVTAEGAAIVVGNFLQTYLPLVTVP